MKLDRDLLIKMYLRQGETQEDAETKADLDIAENDRLRALKNAPGLPVWNAVHKRWERKT